MPIGQTRLRSEIHSVCSVTEGIKRERERELAFPVHSIRQLNSFDSDPMSHLFTQIKLNMN